MTINVLSTCSYYQSDHCIYTRNVSYANLDTEIGTSDSLLEATLDMYRLSAHNP